VSDPDNRVDGPPVDLPTEAQSSEDTRSSAIRDFLARRTSRLERERRLGQQLRVHVTIDETGWLRDEVELVFTKKPGGTIHPVKLRVGHDARDEDILAGGGVVARCAQYNDALDKLRYLAEHLVELVHQGRVVLALGSPVAYAHGELSRLDELIARRQAACMGHGVTRLAWLVSEIEYFARCDAHLAPIVIAAERAAASVATRDALTPPVARRWLRWITRGLRWARHGKSEPEIAIAISHTPDFQGSKEAT
jgi:hypothetical protein